MINNSQQGVSLFLALVMMSILLSIALGLNTILISQLRILRGVERSLIAFYAADTGIERVLYMDKLCREPGCGGLSWVCKDTTNCDDGIKKSGPGGLTYNLGTASYTVEFKNGASEIKSTGLYKETKRTIKVTR